MKVSGGCGNLHEVRGEQVFNDLHTPRACTTFNTRGILDWLFPSNVWRLVFRGSRRMAPLRHKDGKFRAIAVVGQGETGS